MAVSCLDFQNACWRIGIDPVHIPDLATPSPSEERQGEPFFALVEPMSDDDWVWLREAIPYRFGRLPDEIDRAFITSMRTLVQNGNDALNWSLLPGSCTAVRMKWIRWCESGKFAKLVQRADGGSIEHAVMEDLRRLALYERSYNERITRQRCLRVENARKRSGAREPVLEATKQA